MPVVTGRRDAYGEGKRRAPVPESRPTLLGEAGERDSQRAGRARRPRSCRLASGGQEHGRPPSVEKRGTRCRRQRAEQSSLVALLAAAGPGMGG